MSTAFNCPVCGSRLDVGWTQLGGQPTRTKHTFAQDATASSDLPDVTLRNPWGDTLNPNGTIVLSAVVAGSAAASAWVLSWMIPMASEIPVAIGAITAIGSMAFLLAWQVGAIGQPVPIEVEPPDLASKTIRVEEMHLDAGGVKQMRRYILPVDERQIKDFAYYALHNGSGIAEIPVAHACPSISGPKFRKLRDALVERGHLRWRDRSHRQGVEMTRGGKAFFESVILDAHEED